MSKWATLHSSVILMLIASAWPAPEAAAWGSRAQRSIAGMVIQLTGRRYPDLLKSEEGSFEDDVLSGAVDGVKALGKDIPLNNDGATVQAVATEIQLLRDVRGYGPSSYFAYRLGVLSALVSDVVFPYGFAWTPEDARVQEQANRDIETHLENFRFPSHRVRLSPIIDTQEYFKSHRPFHESNRKLIREDYLYGTRYQGYLANSTEDYMGRAAEAAAHAWHTVLRADPVPRSMPSTRARLTWYFVSEIDYLVKEKTNSYQAGKIYADFEDVNPGIADAYEEIGDIYYSTQALRNMDRGVREWRIAYDLDGAKRKRLSNKLFNHFFMKGAGYFQRGTQKDIAKDNDLPSALIAFEEAMGYKPNNPDVAAKIQETKIAKAAREERFDTMINIIASAESIMELAEKAAVNRDYVDSISSYKVSIKLFGNVDDEFNTLAEQANNATNDIKRRISNVLNDVLEDASAAIEQGEILEEEHKYNEAVLAYQSVANIVGAIPEDFNQNFTDQKLDMIDLSDRKAAEAKINKVRYDQLLEAQQANPLPAG